MTGILADLRYSARTLLKSPGFTAIAVIALALGVGANTAIFSVVNAVLLAPLPFAGADRLVTVVSLNAQRGEQVGATSYPDFRDARKLNHTLEYLVAYHDDAWALTGPGRTAVDLNVGVVSPDVFPMLGVQAERGRTLTSDEAENPAASPRTVVISHHTWVKEFGRDPSIVGKAITLRGLPFTVAGVMPESFNFPVRKDPWDLWTSFAFSGDLRKDDGKPGMAEQRGSHYLTMTGKLKPGASIEAARADLKVVYASLSKQYPNTNKYREVHVVNALDDLVQSTRPALLLLTAAVCCVLLVACANVANLLLARASGRRRELALRTALGASRSRLIRQVLTESVLLSLMGGLAGLVTGAWGSYLLVRFSPLDVPRIGQVSMDWKVFLFALGVSLATGIAFGIVPALRASQSDPADSLKDGSRGSTEGLTTNKARSLLIVGEIALAVMLLACAGVLLRSLQRLNEEQPGFQAQNVLTATLAFPQSRYNDEKTTLALRAIAQKLRSESSVIAASDIAILPLSGNDMSTDYQVEGHEKPGPERPNTRVNVASPDYFRAMGIRLVAGRDFGPRDTATAPEVVIVNEEFARTAFGNANPLGKRVMPGISRAQNPGWREVVGVVANVQQDQIGRKALPEVFVPQDQLVTPYTFLVIRTRGAARGLVPALQSAVRQVDPDLPVDDLRTMEESVGASLAQPRFETFLLMIFAVLALVLTAVGLYGVISYSVSRRTQEIGTRVALGASRLDILKLVVGQGMLLTGIGVGVGLVGSLVLLRFMVTLLFNVAPGDPVTLFSISLVITMVSLMACYVPARRAAGVDPMLALRYE